MGCGCLGQNLKQIDEPIREIISSLKISKLTLGELADKVSIIFESRLFMNDFSIKLHLKEIFYETDPSINSYSIIHEQLFESFFEIVKNDINLEVILITSFPFLKNFDNKASKYYFGILNEIYSERFSYNFIFLLFLKSFEYFTYKITKIIFMNTADEELKKFCFFVIKEHFVYEKIEKRVVGLLSSFDQFEKNENILDIVDLMQYFENKNVFHIDGIRDFIIKGDFE